MQIGEGGATFRRTLILERYFCPLAPCITYPAKPGSARSRAYYSNAEIKWAPELKTFEWSLSPPLEH